MNYVTKETEKYSKLEPRFIDELKQKKLPLVCLSGNLSLHPSDFKYVVYDGGGSLRGKFIELLDANDYAEFLANNNIKII